MKRAILVALVLSALGLAPATARAAESWLTARALQERFSKIATFSAEVEQTKQARFLARPLKSQVRIEFDRERINWKTLSPIASTIVVDRQGMHVQSAAAPGGANPMAAAGQDPRAVAFVRFIRAVFALDFAELEKDFALSFEGSTMKATPKDGSSLGGMIQSIEMGFSRELKLETVDVRTPDETTHLVFKTFETTEAAAAAAPGQR